MEEPASYFELSFRPNLELVSVVRRFVSEFYATGADPEAVSRVALSIHELLENAIRYGKDRETSVRIEMDPAADRVRIETRNLATAEDAAHVEELVRKIRETDDPFQLLQERMLYAMQRSDGGSGMGLVRIRAEAEMEHVACRLDGDVLVIEVEGSMKGGALQ